MGCKPLSDGALGGDAQTHQIGIDAVLGEHGADRAHGDGRWQDGIAVRLDDHRIAGGQGGEQARIGIPGREGAAADDQPHPATDDFIVLLHDQRRVLALRLFPGGLGRHEALFAPGIGDGLKTAILSVRPTRLKGHHPALARSHHDRMRNLEALLVEAIENLQTDPGAPIRRNFVLQNSRCLPQRQI